MRLYHIQIVKMCSHWIWYLPHFLIYIFNMIDSVRAFKERNKMGRFAEQDPEEKKRKEEEKKQKEEAQKAKAATMKVGDR